MPDSRDVHRLLVEASNAPTIDEIRQHVAAAEEARNTIYAQAAKEREVDLGNAVIRERMTPVRVHEAHTASTDWLGAQETGGDVQAVQREMAAQASLWYSRVPDVVKADTTEFSEQAHGIGRRLAGAHGELAAQAKQAFLAMVDEIYGRDIKAGAFHLAASGLPQVGEGEYPSDLFSGLAVDPGLPGEATSSERATVIQVMEQNAQGQASTDTVEPNDPGLEQHGTADPRKEASRKEAHNMQYANCPTCGGHGKVAARVVPQPSIMDIVAGRHTAASGLPQIDQIVDSFDNPSPTPLPQEVAWPLEPNGQQQVQQTINEAEQQIAERETRKGASRQAFAQAVAQEAYRQALAGYDASGWMGDMGQTPPGPGQQDGGNAPGTNLGMPDDVYGYGGDNGNQPLKPYGADEANDVTNNPGMNWQPGQPTQYDMSGQAGSTQAPNTTQQGPNSRQSSRADQDPEILKALSFIRNRRALLEGQA